MGFITTQTPGCPLKGTNLGTNSCLILKLYFPEAAISPVLSAATQIWHQCHLKSMLFDFIYSFDMLEKHVFSKGFEHKRGVLVALTEAALTGSLFI